MRTLGCNVTTVIGKIASVEIPIDKIEAVSQHPEVVEIEIQMGFKKELDDSIEEINANSLRNGNPPFGGDGKFTGKDVMVAIFDFGYKYDHRVFRDPSDETKSRILFLYDQLLSRDPGDTEPKNSSGNTIIGVEYSKAQIESAIALIDGDGDPTTVVRHEPDDHGTHVAGIAAGNGLQPGNCHGAFHYVGVAPESDLILVRLRTGTKQVGESNNIVDAIDYIKGKVISLDKPAVINMSFGDNIGAHDGTSLLEEAIDSFLTTDLPDKGFSIVKSAGNAANDEKHANTTIPWEASDDTRTFIMNVNPPSGADPKDIEIDFWYPDIGNIEIEVKPPGNNITGTNKTSPAPGNGNTVSFTEDTNNSTVEITSQESVKNGKSRIYVTIETTGPNRVLSGDWKFILKNEDIEDLEVNAWIERDQPGTWKTFETKNGTISIPGTSAEVITVGNYVYKGKDAGKISKSSSWGPTTDGDPKPDIAAPGTNVMSAKHDPDDGSCCDCCYDFYIAKSGTSMAAPHVTGVIALMLEKNENLTHTEIKTLLMDNADASDLPGSNTENKFGAGRLDAKATIDTITTGGRSLSSIPSPEMIHSFATQQTPHLILGEGTPLKRLIDTPIGGEVYDLGLKHFRQIRKLINRNKRMATVWHRNKGPLMVHHIIRCSMMPKLEMPGNN